MVGKTGRRKLVSSWRSGKVALETSEGYGGNDFMSYTLVSS